MNKPVLGLVLGGVLGALDGLTALFSAPEVKPEIMTIVAGSTGKGLLAGVVVHVATRKRFRIVVLRGGQPVLLTIREDSSQPQKATGE